MNLAPIALFAYKRPSHMARTLDALAGNEPARDSELYIYCDGPREGGKATDRRDIESTRELARAESRFRKVSLIERPSNLGLAGSIIAGVTEVLGRHDRVIVLEDDIVPSKGFLDYANGALGTYADEELVGCIHAWNYHLDSGDYLPSTFFLKGADCWGWATWRRAWNLFRPAGQELLDEILARGLAYDFDRRGTHPFLATLKDQIAGRNDSWAIRWHASLYLQGRYCLHPTRPIVRNIGFDGTGTHCGLADLRQDPVDSIELRRIPIQESEWFFRAYRQAGPGAGASPSAWKGLKASLKRLIRPST